MDVDKIKAAWMARYGTTEEQWENFQQQTPSTDASINQHREGHDFDSFDEVASKMEFIFCPDEREMGWRYRTKADHFRRLAERLAGDNPVQAKQYRDEARFWDKMSRDCFQQSNENRRKL